MSFPDSLDNLPTGRGVGTPDPAGDSNAQATGVNSLEIKVGINDSTDEASLDYRVSKLSLNAATKFQYNSGQLQKQDHGSSAWEDFTIKGINLSMIPPGFDPNVPRPYDSLSNIAQVKWFAENFSAAGGNAIRLYVNILPGSSTQGVIGQIDDRSWYAALDILHDHGIYVLLDTYVNFFSSYNTAALTAWYKNQKAMEFISLVARFGGHPAIMGYLFGNETNLSGNLQSSGMNLAAWWAYANQVAGDLKEIDSSHIIGISSGLGSTSSIAAAVSAENAGTLDNFDFHGANVYRGSGWDLPVTSGSNFFTVGWVPTNDKPVIITETGVDAYDNTGGVVNETTQATAAVGAWETFDRGKCSGILYFSAFDELWKTGNANGNPNIAGDNASIHSTKGFTANTDDFYMPDGFANEQYFGWWNPISSTPYSVPPAARAVVSAMQIAWSN